MCQNSEEVGQKLNKKHLENRTKNESKLTKTKSLKSKKNFHDLLHISQIPNLSRYADPPFKNTTKGFTRISLSHFDGQF